MLQVEYDKDEHVAVLKPDGPLGEDDFTSARALLDPQIEERGPLTGIMIQAREFPGWEDWRSLQEHLRFVQDHHRRVSRVALVTDSDIGRAAEILGDHFTEADLKHFDHDDAGAALQWVRNG